MSFDVIEALEYFSTRKNYNHTEVIVPCKIQQWYPVSYSFTRAEWRIYASVYFASIGSDNGFSPVRRQVSADLLPFRRKEQISLKCFLKLKKKHAFANVIGKMAVILSRPQCIEMPIEIERWYLILDMTLCFWRQNYKWNVFPKDPLIRLFSSLIPPLKSILI